MSRRVVVDWGLNVVPFDPQTRRRNLWGAVFAGALTATATAAGVWFAGREGLHLQTLPSELFGDFWEVARSEPRAAALASLAALFGGLAGCWTFWETFKPREIGIRHMRGRRYLDGKEAIQKVQQLARAESKGSTEGVPLSQDFNFSAERETTHTLIVGGVGAGKTTIAHHILRGIFDKNDHALIVDWKGDFTAAYPGDYVLNLPWHFVAPAPSRPPMVWRDCFQGKAKPLKTVATVEQLTQTNTQAQAAQQEAGELPESVEHSITHALPPEIGLIFEALKVGDLLSNKGSTPTANATHNGHLRHYRPRQPRRDRSKKFCSVQSWHVRFVVGLCCYVTAQRPRKPLRHRSRPPRPGREIQ